MERNWFPILAIGLVVIALLVAGSYSLMTNFSIGGISQEDYDSLLQERDSLKSQLKEAQDQALSINQQFNALKLETSGTTKKTPVQKLSNSNCADLEDEKDELENDIDDKEQEIEDLENDIDDKEQEISDAEDDNEDTDNLEDDLSELEDDLDAANEDLDQLNEDLDDVENDLDDNDC